MTKTLILLAFCFILFPLPGKTASLKILIIGDSLTAGYGVAKKQAYPSILESLLNKKRNGSPEVKVINAGTSGSTTASAFSRLKWHLKGAPDILILALGGNDGLRGIKPSASKSNLEKSVQLALKNNIEVFLTEMKLPYNYGKEYRNRFSKIFTELTNKPNIKKLPFLLKGVGGVKKFNLADGIHPNEQGHKMIANNIAPTIIKYINNLQEKNHAPKR